MTVDTAAEGNVNWPLAYQHLWDRYLALSEALDEEREKVRVLTETITAFVQSVHLSGRTIVQHDPTAYERLATAKGKT